VNHIATGRALSPGGELIPPHHRRQQGWWRWRWGQWRRQKRRWRLVEMAPGALPRPSRVLEQRLLSPEIHQWWEQSSGTLSEKLLSPLGFSIPRLYIGEGASSGGCQGLLPHRGRGQGLGHAALVWGQALAPLQLSFGPRPSCGKNRSSGTCFVQFWEYLLCSISETQKQQKIGNWHCGILSIG
jgi:hypothetical protein